MLIPFSVALGLLMHTLSRIRILFILLHAFRVAIRVSSRTQLRCIINVFRTSGGSQPIKRVVGFSLRCVPSVGIMVLALTFATG